MILAKHGLAGGAALLVAGVTLVGSAYFTARATILISIALVVLCAVNLGVQSVPARPYGQRGLGVAQVLKTLLLMAIFVVTFLWPTRGEPLPEVPGLQYWVLSSGSRIAYLKITPEASVRPLPVVFLHGGPGVADMEGDAAYFGQLSEEGYTVYVYDQVGAGRSSRLSDPGGYSVERDAADLEEIRRQIGAERMILIAHSYGAGVAALYIAQHGEHVAKLIVSSPGSLVGGLADAGGPQSRLSTAQTLALYARLLQPRSLTAYSMLQINPRAAHNFAGDAEMDARMEDVYLVTEPALHCAHGETPRRLQGLGFYANQFPQSAQALPPQDFTASLLRYSIPTLVIKGSCDYLSWRSALAYLDAFQGGTAQMVYLRGAGHNAYQDLPDAFRANLLAFLNDQPLPDEYDSRDVPAHYEKGF
jgi:proline iminopeptidase